MVEEGLILFNKYYGDYSLLAGDLKMPDDLVSIPSNAFTGTPITGVILPKNCNSISDSAFYNCSNLKTIVMYDQVKTVGPLAIDELNSLYLYGTLEQFCSIKGGHYGLLNKATEFYINDKLIEHIDFREHPTITSLQ